MAHTTFSRMYRTKNSVEKNLQADRSDKWRTPKFPGYRTNYNLEGFEIISENILPPGCLYSALKPFCDRTECVK